MSKKLYNIICYQKIDNNKIDKLVKLEQENFEYSLYRKQDFIDFNNSQDINYILVFDNQEIIGYAIYFKSIDFNELYKIFVVKQYRRKHIAKQILTLINDKKIFVEVSDKNTNAINFYKNCGFYEINRRKKYYEDNTDAIILQKDN